MLTNHAPSQDASLLRGTLDRATAMLCRSFENDAFCVQPEVDEQLHGALLRMWGRQRALLAKIIWKNIQVCCTG